MMKLGLGRICRTFFCLHLLVMSRFYGAFAWTSEDMELFDLVEEINQNFYVLLGLDQQASTTDIKKAYRRLSLQYHPDKNKKEGAEEQFRKIVAVCEVLKEETRRKQYDHILEYGLPDWRQPIYYYRRVRKLGLIEMLIFLFALLTIGQYIVAWSMYWERKYELEEVLTSKFRKKKQKKGKHQEDDADILIADHVNQIPKPNLRDLFPVRLGHFLITTFISAPTIYAKWREESLKKPVESEEENEEVIVEDRIRKPRKRVKQELPDFYDTPSCVQYSNQNQQIPDNETEVVESYQLTEWNEHNTLALAKAMNKFPGGTVQRWEKIAHAIKRPVTEVTVKAKLMKTSVIVGNVPVSLQGVTGKEITGKEISDCLPSPCDNFGETTQSQVKASKMAIIQIPQSKLHAKEDGSWKQEQQKALERAMQMYPKGTEERWDRIAEQVPGKSKEDCMHRYKALVDLVKKKKSA